MQDPSPLFPSLSKPTNAVLTEIGKAFLLFFLLKDSLKESDYLKAKPGYVKYPHKCI